MKSGIYIIRNTSNGKIYVGSAVNIRKRLIRHRRELNLGIHCNTYLQRAWNKYGDPSFAICCGLSNQMKLKRNVANPLKGIMLTMLKSKKGNKYECPDYR